MEVYVSQFLLLEIEEDHEYDFWSNVNIDDTSLEMLKQLVSSYAQNEDEPLINWICICDEVKSKVKGSLLKFPRLCTYGFYLDHMHCKSLKVAFKCTLCGKTVTPSFTCKQSRFWDELTNEFCVSFLQFHFGNEPTWCEAWTRDEYRSIQNMHDKGYAFMKLRQTNVHLMNGGMKEFLIDVSNIFHQLPRIMTSYLYYVGLNTLSITKPSIFFNEKGTEHFLRPKDSFISILERSKTTLHPHHHITAHAEHTKQHRIRKNAEMIYLD
jgi:hypothetical protein